MHLMARMNIDNVVILVSSTKAPTITVLHSRILNNPLEKYSELPLIDMNLDINHQ